MQRDWPTGQPPECAGVPNKVDVFGRECQNVTNSPPLKRCPTKTSYQGRILRGSTEYIGIDIISSHGIKLNQAYLLLFRSNRSLK